MNRLSWDSDFFALEIAEYLHNGLDTLPNDQNNAFDLIVLKTEDEQPITIEGFYPNFSESKITYSKSIDITNIKGVDSTVFDHDIHPISENELFDLAFESGKYSRFKLDSNFSKDQFESLYKAWIINSLNKKMATKTFYTKYNDTITGFVTLKKNEPSAQIGLIGVRNEFQGQKIGTRLMNAVISYCAEHNVKQLYVATQKSNSQACVFYEKNGFNVHDVLHISHFWKVN
ncbi:GNAT family N-acetyltransferase [Psychroserpens luteolus]|uniref:GNAT family N-acetyltransferase n=1 Tax=Psychroserpens luteolus TaxID=2855840 RepID=UPI001E30F8C3|nr:GNAT family N-acetyltransferase [Psychroserpens luteolus]MCD2259790.1 GNAT family N-acetyltransferase [Psychroserpens luteolus]